MQKPGPVFIEMARAAYHANADYFFRINDDTELTANWAKVFVDALHTLPPPYGVVGPYCSTGNIAILEHDFVHRTHMEVFNLTYYPRELPDWWMDTWISFVYGKTRSFKALKVPVVHARPHGRRYEIDFKYRRQIPTLLVRGREMIRDWMVKHDRPQEELTIFDDDVFEKFEHSDVPAPSTHE